MKTLRTLSAFGVLAVVAAGCGDSVAPEDVTLADLVGTWNATSIMFAPLGGGDGIDLVAQFDAALEFTVTSSGAYTLTISAPGEQPEIETGTMTVSNGVITAAASGGGNPGVFEILSFGGSNMTLFFADEEFDFTDDQLDNPTPATMTLVVVRE